jgi:ABC-type transport system involved in cytochrome bd biosynthesis fused ATPase/permease subunit
MAELINHNSAILFSIVILLVGAFILVRRGTETKRMAAFGILVIIVTAAFFSMRPSAGTDASAAEIIAQIGGGKPVLLEFQSQN